MSCQQSLTSVMDSYGIEETSKPNFTEGFIYNSCPRYYHHTSLLHLRFLEASALLDTINLPLWSQRDLR